MANRSFRQDVDSRLSAVTFTPELRQKVHESLDAAPKKRPVRFPRKALVAIAACMALVFGVAAAAAVFPGFERLVQTVGEDVRDLFAPTQVVSVASGIQMEVVAALHDGDSAIVYLTLQDLEGSRIDENTVLLNPHFGDFFPGYSQLVHFDAENGIATYRVEADYTMAGGVQKRLALKVDGLLLGEEYREGVDTGLTLAGIMEANPVPATAIAGPMDTDGPYAQETSISYGEIGDAAIRMEEALSAGTMPLLQPGTGTTSLYGGWVEVSAAGVIEDFLHVQLARESLLSRFENVAIWLDFPGFSYESRLASAATSIGYSGEKAGYSLYPYFEHILEIPQGIAPQDVRVMASGYSYTGFVDDTWAVSFKLEEPQVYSFACNIQMDAWTVNQVVVSSIGIALVGEALPQTNEDGETYIDYTLDEPVRVVLRDGSEAAFGAWAGSTSFGDNTMVSKDAFLQPVALEDIESVWVAGQEFRMPGA